MGGIAIGLNIVGVDTESAKQYVKSKLLNQWVILDGDIKIIEQIEQRVYTPGTPKNKEFEIAMLTPFDRIFLAKKNEALKTFLRNPPDFSYIILIAFQSTGSKIAAAQINAVKPERIFAEAVDKFIDDVFSGLADTHSQKGGVAGGK